MSILCRRFVAECMQSIPGDRPTVQEMTQHELVSMNMGWERMGAWELVGM